MDNRELKEKIVSIIKANSYLEVGYKHSNGTISREGRLHEDDFENVAEEIVNLLLIHDVVQRSEQLICTFELGVENCGFEKKDINTCKNIRKCECCAN